MPRKKRSTLLSLIFWVSAIPGLSLAQSLQATISGIITDSTGAVVSGAEVTAINPATAQRATTVTSAQGFFVLLGTGARSISSN